LGVVRSRIVVVVLAGSMLTSCSFAVDGGIVKGVHYDNSPGCSVLYVPPAIDTLIAGAMAYGVAFPKTGCGATPCATDQDREWGAAFAAVWAASAVYGYYMTCRGESPPLPPPLASKPSTPAPAATCARCDEALPIAQAAARNDDCVKVEDLGAQIKQLDLSFHDKVFARDPTIARCHRLVWELLRGALRASSCEKVREIDLQVASLEPDFHATIFITDPSIAPCLGNELINP
jgi:hypothetical protein